MQIYLTQEFIGLYRRHKDRLKKVYKVLKNGSFNKFKINYVHIKKTKDLRRIIGINLRFRNTDLTHKLDLFYILIQFENCSTINLIIITVYTNFLMLV